MIASPLAGKVLGNDRGQFVMAEWQDPGGVPGQKRLLAPTHLHRSDEEAWYVLEGALMFRIGHDEVEVRSGSAILVPPGTAHTFWNAKADPACYLIIMTPKIHQLIQAIHAMPVRTREALAAVFEEHDSTLLPDQA